MSIGSNLKILRKFFGNSQEEMAGLLQLTRSSYSGYENGVAEPNLQTIVKLSEIYGISTDKILKLDFSVYSDEDLHLLMQDGTDLEGKNLRVLTSLVSENNEELIELIPEKARAGYSLGYSDPDYLKVLPTFSLPFLSKDRKYRSFPIKGDSMPPVVEGSYVVAEFVQNWMLIKNETPCIVVTKEDGIVFKILYNHLSDNQTIELHSTNPFYEPYAVHVKDVIEIWKFVNYISPEMPEIKLSDNQINKTLIDIQKELKELKGKMKL